MIQFNTIYYKIVILKCNGVEGMVSAGEAVCSNRIILHVLTTQVIYLLIKIIQKIAGEKHHAFTVYKVIVFVSL